MSVARAREVMARLRAAGVTVHEWAGWESRGNGYTSNYEGIIIHHTATGFGFAPRVLVDGRPDLRGPLCNTAGNADGSVTMIAAHPANHAGAGSGPSLGPLPRTTLFNPRVWGHEIVYPGTVPMTDAQYRTAQILSRISVDVFGYGQIERARLHAETNGRGYEGKWDIGNGNGTTYNAAEFRRGAATILEDDTMAGLTKNDLREAFLEALREVRHARYDDDRNDVDRDREGVSRLINIDTDGDAVIQALNTTNTLLSQVLAELKDRSL